MLARHWRDIVCWSGYAEIQKRICLDRSYFITLWHRKCQIWRVVVNIFAKLANPQHKWNNNETSSVSEWFNCRLKKVKFCFAIITYSKSDFASPILLWCLFASKVGFGSALMLDFCFEGTLAVECVGDKLLVSSPSSSSSISPWSVKYPLISTKYENGRNIRKSSARTHFLFNRKNKWWLWSKRVPNGKSFMNWWNEQIPRTSSACLPYMFWLIYSVIAEKRRGMVIHQNRRMDLNLETIATTKCQDMKGSVLLAQAFHWTRYFYWILFL